MKRIAGLSAPPAGLVRFAAAPTAGGTWEDFGSFEAGAAKRELTAALTQRQHGLCAYCEIALVTWDSRVEHFVPQSDPIQGAELACNPANLLAVCMGGSNAAFGPSASAPDPARFLPPAAKNLSCDAAKGDRPAGEFLDPRNVPAQPPVVRVDEEGQLRSDQAGCVQHGIDPAIVDAHIFGLGLNVGRLCHQREAVRAVLAAAFQDLDALGPARRDEGLLVLAGNRLLPDDQGKLAPFFSTARSFFGPAAEVILARPPQPWI